MNSRDSASAKPRRTPTASRLASLCRGLQLVRGPLTDRIVPQGEAAAELLPARLRERVKLNAVDVAQQAFEAERAVQCCLPASGHLRATGLAVPSTCVHIRPLDIWPGTWADSPRR